MNHNSHSQLAAHLSDTFLQRIPPIQKKLFYLGCMIPDKNPATYLKGSVKHRMLRGHNWQNAREYIEKLSDILEKKDRFSTLDYYTLGKLIHYISDAFTYVHNSHFKGSLSAHKAYETGLDTYIKHQCTRSLAVTEISDSLRQIVRDFRMSYLRTGSGFQSDAVYIHTICNSILLHLSGKLM